MPQCAKSRVPLKAFAGCKLWLGGSVQEFRVLRQDAVAVPGARKTHLAMWDGSAQLLLQLKCVAGHAHRLGAAVLRDTAA